MGGASVAVAGDASSGYLNPGMLGELSQSQLYIMHSEYFADVNLEYVGFVYPAPGLGTFSVNVISLNMGEMLITTVDDPEGLSGAQFDAGSFALAFGYGRSLTDKFAIGGTFKYVQEKIWNSSATGLAIDLGTIFTTPFDGVRLGVSISNFGTKMKISGDDLLVQHDIDPIHAGNNNSTNALLTTESFDLPLNLRFGVAYDAMKSENSRLTIEVDGMHPNNNSESVSIGGELALLKESFFLRGGYQNLFLEDNEASYTAGVGLKYNAGNMLLRFDYAYADFQHLQGIHQIGFSLGF